MHLFKVFGLTCLKSALYLPKRTFRRLRYVKIPSDYFLVVEISFSADEGIS